MEDGDSGSTWTMQRQTQKPTSQALVERRVQRMTRVWSKIENLLKPQATYGVNVTSEFLRLT